MRQRTMLIFWTVIALAGVCHNSEAQAPPLTRAGQPVVVAATVIATDQGPRLVTVWKRTVDWPMPLVLRYLDRHRDRNAVPNVALYATDAPADAPLGGRLVWIAYDHALAQAPPPRWAADITVDPATKQIQIVMLKAIALVATLSLHHVTPGASLGPSAPDLTPQTVEEWPKPSEPVSTFAIKPQAAASCLPSSIGATATFSGVFVVGLPDRPSCPAIYFEYSTAAKTWREVTVAPVR